MFKIHGLEVLSKGWLTAVKRCIVLLLLFVPFGLTEGIQAESLEKAESLYAKGFHQESFTQLATMTEPFSRASLWLLAEMYYLGRGVEVDHSLAKKYILKTAAFASKGELFSESRNKIEYIDRTDLALNQRCERDKRFPYNCHSFFEESTLSCRSHYLELKPIELFFYFSDFLTP